MTARNLSIVIVLVLANYLVFSTLAVLAFPATPVTPPAHTAEPTYTPGALPLQRVGTLTYDFLTPSATVVITGTPATVTATTGTPTRRP
jgi:hypothetical protein